MRVVIVGAGIVGLAAARTVLSVRDDAEVIVLEKESGVAMHQTSHNSGVVHAGLYYQPGSLKARLCRRGMGLLREYCVERGLAYEECGKVLVATSRRELARLEGIQERAAANGVSDVVRLGESDLRRVEPHVGGLGGLHSPSTAIVDFAQVARCLHDELRARGASVRLGVAVSAVRDHGSRPELALADGTEAAADRVLVCAGLQADQLARASGRSPDPRIIPFRGEYYALRTGREDLVRGLVYPVPDPALPFLGVHLTRTIHGSVLVGPNAILALAREGYRRRDVNLADVREIAGWSGMRRVAAEHWRVAAAEVARSASRRMFIRDAQRYVPALCPQDVIPAWAGVRAQAVSKGGELLDDFVLDQGRSVVWVRNAPSPAATSSMAIAEELTERLDLHRSTRTGRDGTEIPSSGSGPMA
jgi:(S)-2-hydroxyglutarate dehydrogenase